MVGPLCRVAGGLRLATRVLRDGRGPGVVSGVRRASEVHGVPCYRTFPKLTRSQVIKGEVLSSLMWFWILWHFWHDPDVVLIAGVFLAPWFLDFLRKGHFPYPDPSKWTDEELGIPPDDED